MGICILYVCVCVCVCDCQCVFCTLHFLIEVQYLLNQCVSTHVSLGMKMTAYVQGNNCPSEQDNNLSVLSRHSIFEPPTISEINIETDNSIYTVLALFNFWFNLLFQPLSNHPYFLITIPLFHSAFKDVEYRYLILASLREIAKIVFSKMRER